MIPRVIAHVDMDAFFAAIAQLDNPWLRGQPVIVGGHSIVRGVVASASYEARQFGVKSAMPLYQAMELCPQAIRVPVAMDRYREVNAQLREVWARYSPDVEPVGFEEAYIDLTGTERLLGPPAKVARSIQEDILCTTKLTGSVGVGSSKLLAKIGSKVNKPHGICLIPAGVEEAWLYPRPVAVIPGVGPRLQQRLALFGIHTIGQLARVPLDRLTQAFGLIGADLYATARGQDPRPVSPACSPKSIGGEETFDVDSADPVFLCKILLRITGEICYRLRQHKFVAATISVKFRYSKNFETVQRSITLPVPTADDDVVYATASDLLLCHWDRLRPLRLVGTTLSNFSSNVQLSLFDNVRSIRKHNLNQALDKLRRRFGVGAIQRALLLPAKIFHHGASPQSSQE